jgi:hypothetical protein
MSAIIRPCAVSRQHTAGTSRQRQCRSPEAL